MARLLYIEASPRKERSASIRVAREFVEAYRQTHPGDQVETLDLWKITLPPFDGHVIDAKYRILHGEIHTPAEREAWRTVEEIIAKFNGFDKYLFSLPMWNFGIPYILKHYIDILVQPGYTFSFSPGEGYKGLVTGKPAAVVYARGGAYPPGTPDEAFDLQKRYLETILGFIGFTDIRSIVVEPTLMLGAADYERMVEEKKEAARALAAEFSSPAVG
ncbi:MAG: NAD(P)H-dependent oxidoreductase [Geobacteraceae bacterium]|nr:NAD(P)H-dependent oxidoreductase [Geobacteraceae bacterium]